MAPGTSSPPPSKKCSPAPPRCPSSRCHSAPPSVWGGCSDSQGTRGPGLGRAPGGSFWGCKDAQPTHPSPLAQEPCTPGLKEGPTWLFSSRLPHTPTLRDPWPTVTRGAAALYSSESRGVGAGRGLKPLRTPCLSRLLTGRGSQAQGWGLQQAARLAQGPIPPHGTCCHRAPSEGPHCTGAFHPRAL